MSQPEIACTLGSNELRTQAERWTRLIAGAGTRRAVTGTGLRLHFRRDPAVERELRQLVAVETECCGWATWTVEAAADDLVVAIGSSGHGVSVIHGLFLDEARSSAPGP